jgi:hypothetical protein
VKVSVTLFQTNFSHGLVRDWAGCESIDMSFIDAPQLISIRVSTGLDVFIILRIFIDLDICDSEGVIVVVGVSVGAAITYSTDLI